MVLLVSVKTTIRKPIPNQMSQTKETNKKHTVLYRYLLTLPDRMQTLEARCLSAMILLLGEEYEYDLAPDIPSIA